MSAQQEVHALFQRLCAPLSPSAMLDEVLDERDLQCLYRYLLLESREGEDNTDGFLQKTLTPWILDVVLKGIVVDLLKADSSSADTNTARLLPVLSALSFLLSGLWIHNDSDWNPKNVNNDQTSDKFVWSVHALSECVLKVNDLLPGLLELLRRPSLPAVAHVLIIFLFDKHCIESWLEPVYDIFIDHCLQSLSFHPLHRHVCEHDDLQVQLDVHSLRALTKLFQLNDLPKAVEDQHDLIELANILMRRIFLSEHSQSTLDDISVQTIYALPKSILSVQCYNFVLDQFDVITHRIR
jgi:hypothetical protein